MAILERIVEELASKCEAGGEIAVAEQKHGFGSEKFVHVADDEDISSIRHLFAFEIWKDGIEQRVPQVVFVIPGAHRSEWVVNFAIDNLVPKG